MLVAALATLLREEARASAEATRHADPLSPWHRRDGWRLNSRAERRLLFRAGESEKTVGVRYAEQGYALELDGLETLVRGELRPNDSLWAELGGSRINATVVVAGEKRHVFLHGHAWRLARIDPCITAARAAARRWFTGPHAGQCDRTARGGGREGGKGAPLLILEAMKMEHTIAAPSRGTVKSFHFAVGDPVSDGAELVEFEPEQT